MSTKTILWSLGALLIIGGSIFFGLTTKKEAEVMKQTAPEAQKTNKEIIVTTPTPTKEAPSDAIVDYLVDGLTSDETKTVEATLDNTKPESQSQTTVNTNF